VKSIGSRESEIETRQAGTGLLEKLPVCMDHVNCSWYLFSEVNY